MQLTRDQRSALLRELQDSYDEDGLRQMLSDELGRRLDWYASLHATFPVLLSDVVAAASREGWLVDLLAAAARTRPHNAALNGLVAAILAGLPAGERLELGPADADGTRRFLVPFRRNPGFVGREDDLARLHAVLQTSHQAGIRPAGLTGLGGIGKTQLAVEYAYRHQDDYPDGVFWITATESLLQEFAAVGKYVAPGAASQTNEEQARAAGSYLHAHPRSLVILDNLLGPELLNVPVLADLIPAELPCRVLFTTRRRETGDFPSVEVTVLPVDAALTLLLDNPVRRPLLAPAHPEHATALHICAVLGYLPLALEIARAHLVRLKDLPLADYVNELLQKGALAVIDDRRGGVKGESLPTRHADAVEATLLAQWEQLGSEDATLRDARLLLRVAGQLGEAELIPVARLGLLAGVSGEKDGIFGSPLEGALGELYDWSLVERLQAEQVRLHPLVQEFAKRRTAKDETATFRAGCAERLAAVYRDLAVVAGEYVRRGVDELEYDVAAALELADRQHEPQTLRPLLRLIQLESHTLRTSPDAPQPPKTTFLQQVQKRAVQMGLAELVGQAQTVLVHENSPHLVLHWWVGRDDPALLRVLTGHDDAVLAVAVTPDGRRVVSASNDHTLAVWDLSTGQCERVLRGHKDQARGVAVTPDGQRAVSASHDRTLCVWDLRTGQCQRVLRGHKNEVAAVAVTPDGGRAVSASWDRTLRVWDLGSGKCERVLRGHKDHVAAVAVTPDGGRAVSGSDDSTLRVWDLGSGKCERVLAGHEDWVVAVAVTPDGEHAVSASEDGTLRVWNLLSGHCERVLAGHDGRVHGVAVVPNGRAVIRCRDDGTLCVWDLSTGQCERVLAGHEAAVTAVAVTPDGGRAVSASYDRTLRVWDLGAGQASQPVPVAHESAVYAVALTADGRRAVSASHDRTLRVWDLRSGQCERVLAGHDDAVGSVAVTHNGRCAVSASHDRTLRVWDLRSGQCERVLAGHEADVYAVAATPDWGRAVSGSWDKTLRVWNLGSGQCERVLAGHEDWVNGVAVTPDGRRAVSGSLDKTLRVWDVGTGQCERVLAGHEGGVDAVAVTMDGGVAVSASRDGTLRVWDLHLGQCERVLTGHDSWVHAVAVTPDGGHAVSASDDRTLRVWDLPNGSCLVVIQLDAGLPCVAVTEGDKTTESGRAAFRIVAGDALGGVYCLSYSEP